MPRSCFGAFLLVALAGCNDSAHAPVAAPPTPSASVMTSQSAPPPPPEAGAPASASPSLVPDTPAGRQLSWVLSAMASPPGEADVASHFGPVFLAAVSPAKVVAILGQTAQAGPYTVDTVTQGATPERLVAVVHGTQGPRIRISIAVELAAPNSIEGLLLRPALDVKPAASWDEVQALARAVAPRVNLLAARIDGDKCTPLSSIEPTSQLALGSAFKLYILDALAIQIAAGKHRWDETIAIDDALKSLPSGDMANEPAGKTFTVRHFAEQMISVSDNTATDHLLAFVGRAAVEDAVKTSGHAAPSRMVPFLSTRDLFALKLAATQDERNAYVAADVAGKRKMLASLEHRDVLGTLAQAVAWKKPLMIDSLEWFASPEDLCKLMVALKAHADRPATAPVGAILSINPGIPDEKKAYDYIGFKGGSEPGVLNTTWLLRRARDGKWLFLTTGFNDRDNAIDEEKAITAGTTAREYLGRSDGP